ncbi:hypothetical protein C8Q76DRAFT_224028 [Earliella scabrosa]|nr:hypothetical protein C8Q76DRAFT_224028 [Earliella scabrosa]
MPAPPNRVSSSVDIRSSFNAPPPRPPSSLCISGQLEQLKQITPPQQKRLVDDLERRINPLFDALNCEALSKPLCEQLLVLVRAMEAHDRDQALAIHMDILTRASGTEDIGLWMSGIKQLIVRLVRSSRASLNLSHAWWYGYL